MIDINELEKEVANDLATERMSKAKSQLKAVSRDIQHAELLLANLQRQKKDLLIAISEGTN